MATELQSIEEMQADTIWLHECIDSLRADYKGKYVAVKDKAIIAANKSLDLLISDLQKKNIDPRFVLIEFITAKPVRMIFRRK